MKKNIFLILFLLPFFTIAQTVVSGKIIDEQGNPVSFANVVFVNSTIGTYSDIDGKFSLYAEKRYREIEVSFVGFASKKIRLEQANTSNLVIILAEGEELSEVIVVAKPKKALSKKENPAYPILQGIWKNKSKNGIENTLSYQYKKHSITELGINNLDTLFLKRALQKDYDTIRKILSEKKYKEKFTVPMYLKEKIEFVYGNNELNKTRTDTYAERSQGVVQNGYGLERIGNAFDDFNIYENSYIILNRPFISPLSEFGYGVYHYVLNDSIIEENRKFYKVYFFPREDQDLALEGSFLVDSKSFIIKTIEMKTTPKTNVNLVRDLFFQKHFKIINDSVYLPYREINEGDFTVFSKDDSEKGMYIRRTTEFSDVLLNQPKDANFYDQIKEQTRRFQYEKDEDYWKKNELTSVNLLKTRALIQEIGNNKRIRRVSDVVDIIGSGYIPMGKHLQFGAFWQTLTTNDVEGLRIRTGFRTFNSTEDRFRSYFYGAYGTKDNDFKYGVSAKYLLLHKPRIVVGAAYQNDNLQLGGVIQHNDAQLNFVNPSNFMLSRGKNYYLTKNQCIQGVFSYNPHKNLELSLFGIYQNSRPAAPEHFSIAYQKTPTAEVLHQYSDFQSGFIFTYTPKRNVYGFGVEQRYGTKLYSTYSLKYTRGTQGVIKSQFDYDKVQLLVSRPTPIWKIGTLRSTLKAGKIFGAAPLTVLTPTPVNQAYTLTPQAFALLDYYDFITDTYINGYFEHHFDGFIFNRIPFIKKAGLRSLAFARFAYGTLSVENRLANFSNIINYNAPERLYWEYGFGIENIGVGNFRFIRVDFVWRNDFNDVNGVRNPKFGIRVGILPTF
ncbi:DUF5686 and carboxypeptidase-like regulatory domain-containing protein [Capnocytophaga canimorsus]|uniref:DUF5686 and carboxypeptidase-like regulatory domain-containing protein n=1 Tax=Capnocytophaga canimorsus TaxID=28188 RepID=UPI0037CFFE85